MDKIKIDSDENIIIGNALINNNSNEKKINHVKHHQNKLLSSTRAILILKIKICT